MRDQQPVGAAWPREIELLTGRHADRVATVAQGLARRWWAWLVLPEGASRTRCCWVHRWPAQLGNGWSWRWQPWRLAAWLAAGSSCPTRPLSTG
jgi:hypothetical protein